jgi:hypothetical protein
VDVFGKLQQQTAFQRKQKLVTAHSEKKGAIKPIFGFLACHLYVSTFGLFLNQSDVVV